MSNIPKNPKKSNQYIIGKNALPEFYDHLDKHGRYKLYKDRPLVWTLHDVFIPTQFESFDAVVQFFEINSDTSSNKKETETLAPEAYKEQMFAKIRLACHLAKEYLISKGYFLGHQIGNSNFMEISSYSKLFSFYQKRYDAKNINERMYFCTFLKCVISFMHIIQYDKFKIDYTNNYIDIRNKEFIDRIINIFNDEHYFIYEETDSVKLTWESNEMHGEIESDGYRFPISATFDVKSLWSIVEKMNGKEKYNSIEAFKDLHRMRIEVGNGNEALHVARILIKKLAETDPEYKDINREKIVSSFHLESSGDFTNKEIITDFIQESLQTDIAFRKEFRDILNNIKDKKERKDGGPGDDHRQELKLSRSGKWGKAGIEIQIVPRENLHEAGFSHHDVYRMKRQINEKIRLQWYIRSHGIKSIIQRIMKENIQKNNGICTIQVTEDQIYQHAINHLWLIEIVSWEEHPNKQTRSYSNIETLEKYSKNYPDTAKSLKTINKFNSDILKIISDSQKK